MKRYEMTEEELWEYHTYAKADGRVSSASWVERFRIPEGAVYVPSKLFEKYVRVAVTADLWKRLDDAYHEHDPDTRSCDGNARYLAWQELGSALKELHNAEKTPPQVRGSTIS